LEFIATSRMQHYQRNHQMGAHSQENSPAATSRKPLFGSVWMALFALLREELAQLGMAPVSRDGSLSRRP
jgi:hypothetical protein